MNWDREFGKLKMEEVARNFERVAKEFQAAEKELNKIYFLPWAIRQRLENHKN